MKKLMLAVLLGVGAVALSGCGADACGKQAECAKKSGTAFSETECRTQDKTDREKAASKNCGSQYDETASCIAGLTCDQLISSDAIVANCGAKLTAYLKCVQ